MVECEFFENPCSFLDFYVLIDTWWNVNWGIGAQVGDQTAVLIDTWWNVNFH